MVVGSPDNNMQKNETGPFCYTIHKINSKWMEDLNVRQKTIKVLKKNAGSTLFDLSHSNLFLDMSLEPREAKTKINYWDMIKTKSLCTAKETINKRKRQPTEWEKIFANDISNKGLVFKICKFHPYNK